jgi:hypothetical protein
VRRAAARGGNLAETAALGKSLGKIVSPSILSENALMIYQMKMLAT